MEKEKKDDMAKEIRVAELFAGVGGFRVGLERASKKYKIVWSNQWEPAKKKQIASEIYKKRFGEENHSNEDISRVLTSHIPDFDLLVGGFPCQDYSVARTLNQAKGLEGKKGVLWWQIHRILKDKEEKPKFLFLENVDRLLKSPAKQRGRDFAVMLASLADLGYTVEWRVINAADYGMPQRRRRVLFLGYHRDSLIAKKISKTTPSAWITASGILAKSFKIKSSEDKVKEFSLFGKLPDISEKFNKEAKNSPFFNAGIMIDRRVWTLDARPEYEGKRAKLGDILMSENKVPQEFFIDTKSLNSWNYHKGAKNEDRMNKKNGFTYKYTEGKMIFPDSLDAPSRTIVTGEGGSSPSRFKHVVKTESGKLRRLTPLELERLNMFPDNHTREGTDVERAFLMGNALVVGLVERIGLTLISEMS
jgi:DNA (cytosine-5)-methyltransferase 1